MKSNASTVSVLPWRKLPATARDHNRTQERGRIITSEALRERHIVGHSPPQRSANLTSNASTESVVPWRRAPSSTSSFTRDDPPHQATTGRDLLSVSLSACGHTHNTNSDESWWWIRLVAPAAMAIALDRPEVTLVAHLKQTLLQGAQTGSQ